MFRHTVNGCWFCFKWGLLSAVAAALAIGAYYYHHVDEELRRRVEAALAAKYPRLTVRVHAAQFVEGQGIEVRGLSISAPQARGPAAQLFHCDELLIACSTNVQDLVQGDPQFHCVTLRRCTLRATRQPDGAWSAGRLLPVPKFGDCAPRIVVENAVVEIVDPSARPASTLTLRDVNLAFLPPGSAARRAGRVLEVSGRLSADYVRRVELAGWVDLNGNGWRLSGAVEAECGPELIAALPTPLAERGGELRALRGRARGKFDVAYAAGQKRPLSWNFDGQIARGRLDDPRLPYPLTDLSATVRASHTGVIIDDLSARAGQASLRLTARRDGYSPDSPAQLAGSIARLRLEEPLARKLPESLRQHWYRFLPAGEIDARFELAFDGRAWRPRADVKCLAVSFTSHKFPYRLEQGAGTITLQDDVLRLALTAYSGSAPVHLEGEIYHPGEHFTGALQIRGDDVPLDEKLLTALPAKAGQVVRSLAPRGTFSGLLTVYRNDPQRAEIHQHANLTFNRCSITYEKFPYPITNIRGRIEVRDARWSFHALQGNNDTGVVTCSGELAPVEGGQQLRLNIQGRKVPLEEELRDAMPESMQHLWSSLRPRGEVDLTAEVSYLSGNSRMSIDLVAQPREETASIEPVSFPYRMERLRGEIHYRDGRAMFRNLSAVHGRTTLSAQGGHCDLQTDGSWRLRLERVFVDRLRAEHDLLAALPERLRHAVTELNPVGQMNLHGAIDFARLGKPGAPLQTAWDLKLDLDRTAVECGVKLENASGSVQLSGASEGDRFYSHGELALDFVSFRDFHFTEVMGPFYVDNQRALVGSLAQQASREQPARRVTAQLYGGTVVGDCQVTFGPTPTYNLRAWLTNAHLSQFAKETLTSKERLQGKVQGNVNLRGVGKGTGTLSGSGSIQLRDADIYELPVMVALLKILSIRAPDTTAFTKSDINFRLQGEHVIFDHLSFNGDAVSLVGQGQANLDKQVDLTFHALVGRDEFQIPVLRGLIGEASQQIMQIHVTGTLDHPETRREAFPGVSQALEQLQANMEGKPAEPQKPFGWLRPATRR